MVRLSDCHQVSRDVWLGGCLLSSLSTVLSVNFCFLTSGTSEEDFGLQPTTEPGRLTETFHCVHPPGLGLQSVFWPGSQTGNIRQASLTPRHPHRSQSSGLWFPSLDSPEPGLWQEGSSHQPASVVSSVNIARFRRQR